MQTAADNDRNHSAERMPQVCNAARNSLNRHLRLIKQEIADTETEISVSLEMQIESATHARNTLRASNGLGRAEIDRHVAQIKKLGDKAAELVRKLELLKAQVKQLEEVKVDIKQSA